MYAWTELYYFESGARKIINELPYSFCVVTKLREHWDETNTKVTQRKSQLDTMLADSQQYESKRAELENWLHRMETRLERIMPVGHTADVLEAQLREQKVRPPKSTVHFQLTSVSLPCSGLAFHFSYFFWKLLWMWQNIETNETDDLISYCSWLIKGSVFQSGGSNTWALIFLESFWIVILNSQYFCIC